jgi:hypothetical protein
MASHFSTILRRLLEAPPVSAPAHAAKTGADGDYKTFLVQCETFRCLAYCDKAGKWRAVHDNRELPAIKNIICAV